LKFLLPISLGIAVGALGTFVQDMVVDRTRVATAKREGVAPANDVSDAPGARGAPVQDLLGVVVARYVVEVAARAEGRVTAIAVQLGDRVERGATVASLDDRSLRDELAAARAALRALAADRDKTESQLAEAREKKLRDEKVSHVLSDEELARVRYEEKYAESQLQITEARLDEQQAKVAVLERSLEETQVRAPFGGSIAARYVSPGAMVNPGTPLVRLVSSGDALVRFAIPEALGPQVRVGMPVTVDVDGAALSGTVEKLAPEVDAASRMVVAEARVVVPDGHPDMALAGRVARVHVGAALAGEGQPR
jgi:RND family efflux transporter MFP subunit